MLKIGFLTKIDDVFLEVEVHDLLNANTNVRLCIKSSIAILDSYLQMTLTTNYQNLICKPPINFFFLQRSTHTKYLKNYKFKPTVY